MLRLGRFIGGYPLPARLRICLDAAGAASFAAGFSAAVAAGFSSAAKPPFRNALQRYPAGLPVCCLALRTARSATLLTIQSKLAWPTEFTSASGAGFM